MRTVLVKNFDLDFYKKVSGVYIFKNIINGRVYVGESCNLWRRLNEHLKLRTGHEALVHDYRLELVELVIITGPEFKSAEYRKLFEKISQQNYSLFYKRN
ncbi:MAG: GIY-YIG nuclease family protein [Mycoplasma sp.]